MPQKKQMPRRPKGISDKFPLALRSKMWTFMANNDGNVAKTCREFKIGRSTMDSLRKRYAHEIQDQKEAFKAELMGQAIEDRELAMDVLRETLKTQLEMLSDPKTARFVRPSDIARSMEMLDRMIRLEAVNNAGQTPEDNAKDESEVSKSIDAFLDKESAEDS